MKYINQPPLRFVHGQRVSIFWQKLANGIQALDAPAWQLQDEEAALAALVDAERTARDVAQLTAGLAPKRVKVLRALAVEIVDEEQAGGVAG